MLLGIRWKLCLLTFLVVGSVTGAFSLLASRIMDDFALQQLIQRGISIGETAASPAAYSLLEQDNLALDNLVARLEGSQADIAFAAVVDGEGVVRAHSNIVEGESSLPVGVGGALESDREGALVRRARHRGGVVFEFQVPISFAGRRLGFVCLGISNGALVAAQSRVRKGLLALSTGIICLGLLGTWLVSYYVAKPIQLLSSGVSHLSVGLDPPEVPVVTRDELGVLTRNFNNMARLITEQKRTLEAYSEELEIAYVSTIRVLSASIEARDPYTLGHSERVAEYGLEVGTLLHLDQDDLKKLELACLLHDIGKIRTPDQVLNKAGKLNRSERNMIMRHPHDGAEVLNLVKSMASIVPAVLHHHERYDGQGYPAGLQGAEIPLFASIIAVVDAYDAMTTSRSYRVGMSSDHAVQQLMEWRGVQFDPNLVDLFVEVLDRNGANPSGPLNQAPAA